MEQFTNRERQAWRETSRKVESLKPGSLIKALHSLKITGTRNNRISQIPLNPHRYLTSTPPANDLNLATTSSVGWTRQSSPNGKTALATLEL